MTDIEIGSRIGIDSRLKIDSSTVAQRTFTDWVMVVRVNPGRLSDHLVHDLKHDNTLPATFNRLDEFRSYLISQHACRIAVSLAAPVWKRYRRWVERQARGGIRS